MLVEVKVPQLSESVSGGDAARLAQEAGEYVEARRESDRHRDRQGRAGAAGPEAGLLTKIVKADGRHGVSNEVIATIDTEAKAPRPQGAAAAAPAAAPAPAPRKPRRPAALGTRSGKARNRLRCRPRANWRREQSRSSVVSGTGVAAASPRKM
jgi:2-oxoglutarate dehydrogenase E2 component (dihydrolipoamide succinyltransferase)